MAHIRYLVAPFSMLLLIGQVEAGTFNDLPSFQAATNSLTLINFDVDTNGQSTVQGTQIGATYTSLGADFPAGNLFGAFTQPVSSPTGWLNNTFVGADAIFDATFNVGGITAVGVHNVLASGIPSGSRLQAYNGNTLLESVLSDTDGNTLDFFGVTTSTPITRFTITVLDAQGWGMDDLYFGQAVPEPSTLALGAFGLFGLVIAARKRLG